MRPLACTFRCARSDPTGNGRGGKGVDGVRAPGDAGQPVGLDRTRPRADQSVVGDGMQQMPVQPEGDLAAGPAEPDQVCGAGDADQTVAGHGPLDLDSSAFG